MTRIPYRDLTTLDQRSRDALAGRPNLNLYRVMLHADHVAPAWLEMSRAVVRDSRIGTRAREIVILRVANLSGSAYQLHQHELVGRMVGLTDAEIAALKLDNDLDALDERERCLVRFVDQVVQEGGGRPDTLAQLSQWLDYGQVMEVILVVGMYMYAARLIATFEIDLEDDPGREAGLRNTFADGHDRSPAPRTGPATDDRP